MVLSFSLNFLRNSKLFSNSNVFQLALLKLSLERKLHFIEFFLKRVVLLSQSLSHSVIFSFKFLVLLGMKVFDILEPFGCLFLANDAVTLSVLDVSHYLIMSLALFFVLLALFLYLKFIEFIFLFCNSRIFLPSLPSKLQTFLSSFGLSFELSNSFTFT